MAFGLDPNADGMATNSERVEHHADVITAVEAAFGDVDAPDLLAKLADIGVPAGKVRSLDEVYEWEQTKSQGLLVDVAHQSLGEATLPGSPLRFFDTEGEETTGRDHRAPPVLDTDGATIRAWLDLVDR